MKKVLLKKMFNSSSHMLKRVQFYESYVDKGFNSSSQIEKKGFHSVSHINRKGFNSVNHSFFKSSILESNFRKGFQCLESFFSKKTLWITLKKRLNYLSRIQQISSIFCVISKKSSVLWVIFKKKILSHI